MNRAFTTCLSLLFVCWLLGCNSSEAQQVNSINYNASSSSQEQDADSSDWMVWRGPNGNGVAPAGQDPVTQWSDSENVIWKTEVPGRGHASPIILGNQIFLATSDQEAGTQSVLCYSRDKGELDWNTSVNEGGLRGRIHRNNNHASSTISTDGKHVFALFENNDSIRMYVLTLDGELAWEKDLGPYSPHFPFGFGASLLIHGDHVIVPGESREGFLVALNKDTGDEVWRIDRTSSSYSSPIVTKIDGTEMLLISGGKKVDAINPSNGESIWSADAVWNVSCGTMVWDGNMVFASGGFPEPQTLAINGENGDVVWTNSVKCYEQSMLAYDGYIYAVSDNGSIYCWRAKDGQEMWNEKWFAGRRDGVSSSPVLVGDKIYASLESGKTFVIRATPDKYELIAENQLGDSAFATPAFLDSKMYARFAKDGQEWLYCFGKE